MNETRLKPQALSEKTGRTTTVSSRKSAVQHAVQHAVFASAAFALCHAGAHAKPSKTQKLPGVWGWTSGTQTYLRARPGAQTPPVAKVATHTKLFVYGTYDGWYRVETTDHIFGWVHSSYLNAPGADKLQELSHRKAKLASDRTANQTMYGSKELLARHYAQYGAPGAAKGLQKHGVRVAGRTKVTSKSVKSNPRIAVTPSVRTVSTHGTRIARRAEMRREVPSASDPSFNDVGNVRIAPSQGLAPRPSLKVKTASAKTETLKTETLKTNLALTAARDKALRANAIRDKSAHDKAAQRTRLAAADARRVAAAQQESAQRQMAERAIAQREAKQRLVQAQQAQRQAQQQAQSQKWAQAAASRRAAQQAAAQRSAARVAAREAASSKRHQARLWAYRQAQARRVARAAAHQQRLAAKRENMRRRFNGTVAMSPPPTTAPGLRPLSPEELLRARDEYLTQKGGAADPTISQTPGEATVTPSSFSPSFPTDGFVQASFTQTSFQDSFDQGAFVQAAFSPAKRDSALFVPTTHAPSAFNDEWVSPLSGAKSKASLPALLTPPRKSQTNVRVVKKFVAKTAKKVVRKAAPKAVAKVAVKAPSRGGSMRDYATYASRPQNEFGDGMAKQALSYRGMPYISGAASPRRGFDCSGLIYFMLRQRGYNPPRTAAGMTRMGHSVGKASLQKGDIVLFANTYKRGVSHVGVYMGNGKFVHAANSRAGVRVDSLFSGYYGSKYWGARRMK